VFVLTERTRNCFRSGTKLRLSQVQTQHNQRRHPPFAMVRPETSAGHFRLLSRRSYAKSY
jgi:hypothetical protein